MFAKFDKWMQRLGKEESWRRDAIEIGIAAMIVGILLALLGLW
jgi:hypothetical protein